MNAPGGRRGGGRAGRQSVRAASSRPEPFLTRTLTPVELVSAEGLEILEHNADTILDEVGVEVRDYPSAAEAVRRRRRRRRRQPGAVPAWHVPPDRAGDRAGRVHPARPQPGQQRADRWRRHRVRPQLRLAVRPRPRRRPPLRHARRLPELREARLPVAAPAPLGRHGVRAGRRPGQQAPPRHGVRPPPLQRQGVHGVGHRRRAGGRQRRAGAHRLRRRPRRPHRDDEPDQRLVAAGVGRDDARRGRGLRRRTTRRRSSRRSSSPGRWRRPRRPASRPRRSPRRSPG